MPTIAANGVELFYDEAGPADAPVILLIMGLATQMIAWPDDFIARLVDAGFRVVRYDNRDIGLSTRFDGAASPSVLWAFLASKLGLSLRTPYTLTDMADDAAGLLDGLGIARAHVVGASMGGMIAQLVAAKYPDRVISLTSIMSTSGARGLPGPTNELRKRLMARRPPNPTRDQAIALSERTLQLISYPDPARPAGAFREAAARAFDRSYNPAGATRQLLAVIADGDRSARLARIKAPTLVIHGAADPLVPAKNSEDIARRVPGARLEIIDEMAHDLPPSQLTRLTGLILDHVKAAA